MTRRAIEEDEEEFDELEYTGPDEGEVYDRFEKIQKTFKSYIKLIINMVILITKTIKARQKFSECYLRVEVGTKISQHYDRSCFSSR